MWREVVLSPSSSSSIVCCGGRKGFLNSLVLGPWIWVLVRDRTWGGVGGDRSSCPPLSCSLSEHNDGVVIFVSVRELPENIRELEPESAAG